MRSLCVGTGRKADHSPAGPTSVVKIRAATSPMLSNTGVSETRVSDLMAMQGESRLCALYLFGTRAEEHRLMRTVWGPWQVGNLDATDYAKKAKQWAHGLRLVDPTIKLVSCGNTVGLVPSIDAAILYGH
jgi:hypothetical protein